MKKITFLLCVISFAIISQAQIRRYVDLSATGTNDGSSWANAYVNLYTALSSGSVGDTLWVAQGVYKAPAGDCFYVDGLHLIGGFEGTESNIEERNPIENPTILSGDLLGNDNGFDNNDENQSHVIQVFPTGNSCTIDGFHITGGNSTTSLLGPERVGAGIKMGSGTFTNLEIKNCLFYYNVAINGGAIYISSHSVLIENCIFMNDSALMKGSAIYNYSALTIRNCTFVSNSETVFHNVGNGLFSVYNSIFQDHSGTYITFEGLAEYTFDHCLFNDDPSSFTGITTFTNNLINTDAMLDPDYIPLFGSLAINGGLNDNVIATSDIIGEERIIGGVVDMGAYEYVFSPIVVSISTDAAETSEQIVQATIQFSETVEGLELNDFRIINGTISNLAEVTEGREYTFDITHELTGTVNISLYAGSVHNMYGILNETVDYSYTFSGVNGLADYKANNLVIYPNPSQSGIFYIDNSEGFKTVTATIININGQQVLQQKLSGSTIDLSSLDKGMYFITLEYPNKKISDKQKILIK